MLDPLFVEWGKENLPVDWDLPVMNEDAAYIALAKYGRPQPILDAEQQLDFSLAVSWLHKEFYFMKESKIRTLEEAIGKLDMKTSPGYPFTAAVHTKEELFSQEENFVAWLEADWERLADPGWTCIFQSSQKEELRPIEKIEKNSIRNFLASSVDATVHGDRLFGDMNQKLIDHNLTSCSTVGMSPFGGNWHRLITALGTLKTCFSVDGNSYDASLFAELMWAIMAFRWSCLAPKFQTRRNWQRMWNYYNNLINSVIITPLGTLIMKAIGNPSGSVNTISDNTLALAVFMAYAWIRLCRERGEKPSYRSYLKNVTKKLQGDDNVWSTSLEYVDIFCPFKVQPYFQELGMTITAESMEPSFAWEIGYLSQRSRMKRGMWVPFPDECKMMASIAYVQRSKLNPLATYERLTAFMLAGFYNTFLRRLVKNFADWIEARYAVVADEEWHLLLMQMRTKDYYYTLYTGSCSIQATTDVPRSCGKSLITMRGGRSKTIHTKQQRGDFLLGKMEQNGLISHHGAQWLKTALNPFPDTPIEDCRGIPDYNTEPSVVRRIKKSVPITCPYPDHDGEWSFQVVMWPWLNKQNFNEYTGRYNNFLSTPTPSQIDHGGIEVVCLEVGSPNKEAPGQQFSPTLQPTYRLEIGDDFTKGLSRLIGIGYEISDNTAAIYRQGHSYHYRQSNQIDRGATFMVDQQTGGGEEQPLVAVSVAPMRPMMPTPSDAMNLPDTVDWPAEEGCYVVGSFNGVNEPHYVGYTMPGLVVSNSNLGLTDDRESYQKPGDPDNTANESQYMIPYLRPVGEETPGVPKTFAAPAIKMENINQSFSMFTGLNPMASFTLTAHFYIESFPSIAEENILVLAEPSACYDGMALEMYSRAVQELPVAVQVGLNPNGEWWAEVVEAGAEVLGPMAAALGFPEVTPLVMGGGRLISSAIKANAQRANAQSKKKIPPPTRTQVTMTRGVPSKRKATPKKGN